MMKIPEKDGYLIKVYTSCHRACLYAGMACQLLPKAFEGNPDILCLKG